MEKIFQSKKILLILAVILIAVIFSSYKLLVGGQIKKEAIVKKEQLPKNVIPTLDPSVKVDLVKESKNQEVTLIIENIPDETSSIEYELSYQTSEQGLQGVVGTVDMEKIEDQAYEKNITLGTCSSGRCVYHKVVGEIKLMLKFIGEYGQRVFEKEYTIQ